LALEASIVKTLCPWEFLWFILPKDSARLPKGEESQETAGVDGGSEKIREKHSQI
jgi:hypothetical protein